MHHFIHTEPGHDHRNEDAVLVASHPHDPSVLLCALADGQGGRAGGAEASQTAVTRCIELAAAFPVNQLLEAHSWYPISSATDASVCESPGGGLTTLVGLCITDYQVCGASCGDSAVQLICGGQSVVLTENQRKNPPVGSGAAYPIAFNTKLTPPWKLLLMSDGVWRYVGFETIGELAARKQGQELVSSARQLQLGQSGGRLGDDFSIILVQSD